MSLQEMKSELAGLSPEQQDHLAAFLIHLRHQRDPEIRREITRRNDDRSPQGWISVDVLRENWKD